ncbi:ABC transporter permease subunit [Clostridiaceae bacterium OttesenSCG-928-D20]|nr:ABC transporter permease subunit [Clostridiaceae bacterium OttesenSCG-928-D20]
MDSTSALVNRKRRFSKKQRVLLTMVLPGAIWLFLLRYLPMFGIVIAFKDYKIVSPKGAYSVAKALASGDAYSWMVNELPIWLQYITSKPLMAIAKWFDTGLLPFLRNLSQSDWVGLQNFKFLFLSPDSKVMFRNTILYNVSFIAVGLVISVTFAIMLSELTNKLAGKTYQTLMFFPYFMSWVVASYFVFAFIAPGKGLIIKFQESLGMTVTDWYNTPGPWPYILTIARHWKLIGYSTILYLAAITGIDKTQYEAASIDGATKWQQIRHITIPHIRPMITILLIMDVGRIMNADFGLFYSVPRNSGPLTQMTMVIDTYVYNAFSATGNVGMSSAAGLLQNVIGFICIMTANLIVRKIDEESSLF